MDTASFAAQPYPLWMTWGLQDERPRVVRVIGWVWDGKEVPDLLPVVHTGDGPLSVATAISIGSLFDSEDDAIAAAQVARR